MTGPFERRGGRSPDPEGLGHERTASTDRTAATEVAPSGSLGGYPAGYPPIADARPDPETLVEVALDRFGTDRLGDEHLETDRLLGVAHRQRSPEARLRAALRADAGRILANWIVRIANLPIYRARPDLALDQLMDGLPAVVHAVLQATATPDPNLDSEPAARAAEVAAEHGRRRAAAGFPVGAVLTEVRELHAELLAQLWRAADEIAASDDSADGAPARRALVERFAVAIGDLGIASVDAWVAASAAVEPEAESDRDQGPDETGNRGAPR